MQLRFFFQELLFNISLHALKDRQDMKNVAWRLGYFFGSEIVNFLIFWV